MHAVYFITAVKVKWNPWKIVRFYNTLTKHLLLYVGTFFLLLCLPGSIVIYIILCTLYYNVKTLCKLQNAINILNIDIVEGLFAFARLLPCFINTLVLRRVSPLLRRPKWTTYHGLSRTGSRGTPNGALFTHRYDTARSGHMTCRSVTTCSINPCASASQTFWPWKK